MRDNLNYARTYESFNKISLSTYDAEEFCYSIHVCIKAFYLAHVNYFTLSKRHFGETMTEKNQNPEAWHAFFSREIITSIIYDICPCSVMKREKNFQFKLWLTWK